MAERLSGGNAALALLGNSVATAAGLVALILALGSISGAHLNPAVTLSHWLRGEIHGATALVYIAAQGIGAAFGAILAHAMFDEPLIVLSTHARSGAGQLVGEFVATFGLVLTLLGCRRSQPQATAYAVGLFILAGYWFTSSTSFANPSVTIARVLTDSFTGIRPVDAPAFIAAQLAGACAATFLSAWLWPRSNETRGEHRLGRELQAHSDENNASKY